MRKIFRKVKQAPTNLVARMRKLTFKHNLTDFMRLMKDTVVYPFQENGIMVKTNQMSIYC